MTNDPGGYTGGPRPAGEPPHPPLFDAPPGKPFYRFKGREPNPPYTDKLIFQCTVARDRVGHVEVGEKVITSEWAYWRLWRYHPGNQAHPLYAGPP